MHDSPDELKMPYNTPFTAWSISASAKTMVGDLPPSSSETGISLSAASRDPAPHFGPTGERDFLNQWMAYQRVADNRPLARQNAKHALRHAGLLADAGKRQRSQWRHLSGLQDDCIAGGQRRRKFLRIGSDGRIPRRDRRYDAERFMHAHRHEVAARRRERLFKRLDARGEVAERVGRARDQSARLGDRLAVVAALQLRERFMACGDQVRNTMQHGGALMRFQPRPVRPAPRR